MEFQARSKLFDHAPNSNSNYLNEHCFVSLMLYVSFPLGYRLWTTELSKLVLAADMVCSVMAEFTFWDRSFFCATANTPGSL